MSQAHTATSDAMKYPAAALELKGSQSTGFVANFGEAERVSGSFLQPLGLCCYCC